MYIVDRSLKSKLELWKSLNLGPTSFIPPFNHSPILGKITYQGQRLQNNTFVMNVTKSKQAKNEIKVGT
jgi:hypothetical protein